MRSEIAHRAGLRFGVVITVAPDQDAAAEEEEPYERGTWVDCTFNHEVPEGGSA